MSVDLNNNCPEGSGSMSREHNLLAASARNIASQFLAERIGTVLTWFVQTFQT